MSLIAHAKILTFHAKSCGAVTTGAADCAIHHGMLVTVTNPRRSAGRFPRKRFPIYTRFQNAMDAFGVSTEKVVADAGLSPRIVEEEHPSVERIARPMALPQRLPS